MSHGRTLDDVVLMTPENIYVNSFKYEPINDLFDAALRGLSSRVKILQRHLPGDVSTIQSASSVSTAQPPLG